ncbi:MAG: thiamine phosphate synthase [Persicimonas sp.]
MKATRREKLDRLDPRVYVILDPKALRSDADLLETARLALRGGAGLLQLRDKQSDARTLVERSEALQDLCDGFDAVFVVNDRLDVALAAGADGVHLGPEDVPVSRARRIAPELIIGASAGSTERARRLEREGADYLGVGAIFDAHESKADASSPRGPAVLEPLTAQVSIPVVGIGGITAETAPRVIGAGAAGVAVIREVVSSDRPEEATRRLLEAGCSDFRSSS